MNETIASSMLLMLVPAMIYVMISDWKTRTIPNWLNAGIAVSGVFFWYFSDLDLWPDVFIRIAVALSLLGFLTSMHVIGQMGGGDVKLLTALALWLPFGGVISMFIIMSISGGVLTIFMLYLHKKKAKKDDVIEVPFGIAIAFAVLWLLTEKFIA